MTRDEHLALAKQRALKYLDAGDLKNAYASMTSDLGKHPELHYPAVIYQVGMLDLIHGDTGKLRRWIEGFQ